jgi:hypothetical protein
MGLKLSNFSTFLSLCDKNYANPDVNRLLNQFKLSVIVLCDPNDPDFISRFDTLDKMTGKNLLFITFSNRRSHSTWFNEWITQQMDLDNEAKERLNHLNKVANMDNMELAELARRFNLSLSQLPAIIITNDLQGNEAVVLETSKEKIAMQLLQLTYDVADRSTPIDLCDLALVKQEPSTTLYSFRATTSNILTDAYCRLQLKKDPNDIGAKVWNDNAVSESVNRLSTMDDTSETALADRVEAVMDYAANRTVQEQCTTAPAGNNRFVIDEHSMQGIEKDTLVTLRTYNYLTRLFVKRPKSNLPEEIKYDYSALALYLSKIFENELAYSIVQQMRKVKGIPMPDFYCKLYNGRNAFDFKVETGHNIFVDLNKKQGKSNWVAPPLGEMRMAYQVLAANNEDLYEFDDVFVDYIWQPLIQQRNKAAHRTPIDWRGFDTTYNYFRRFIEDGYCQELVDLKRRLKSGDNISLF